MYKNIPLYITRSLTVYTYTFKINSDFKRLINKRTEEVGSITLALFLIAFLITDKVVVWSSPVFRYVLYYCNETMMIQ